MEDLHENYEEDNDDPHPCEDFRVAGVYCIDVNFIEEGAVSFTENKVGVLVRLLTFQMQVGFFFREIWIFFFLSSQPVFDEFLVLEYNHVRYELLASDIHRMPRSFFPGCGSQTSR